MALASKAFTSPDPEHSLPSICLSFSHREGLPRGPCRHDAGPRDRRINFAGGNSSSTPTSSILEFLNDCRYITVGKCGSWRKVGGSREKETGGICPTEKIAAATRDLPPPFSLFLPLCVYGGEGALTRWLLEKHIKRIKPAR